MTCYRHYRRASIAVIAAMMAFVCTDSAWAQRVRFGSTDGGPLPTTTAIPSPSFSVPATGVVAQQPGGTLGAPTLGAPPLGTPTFGAPPGVGAPPVGTGVPAPGGLPSVAPPAYGTPTFDPFSSASGGGGILAPPPSSGFPGGTPGMLYPPPNSQPYLSGPGAGGAYPNFPSGPSSLWPNWQPSAAGWPNNMFNDFQTGPYFKVVQDLRWIHTWIPGDEGADVAINDSQFGVTLNYPDFLASGQPLKISPGFIFHFWDGPSPPITNSDLPGTAYSTFFDLDWQTAPENPFGGEFNARFGLFTDFQTVTVDSFRVQGTGLGRFRLTPNLAVKLGVTYLDRVDIKMLPAGGVFWRPTEDLNLDIYFPKPKLSNRIKQLGTADVWGYIGGEYGGDSWTIERANGASDQVDINDMRAYIGLDWTTVRAKRGFFEVGFVFKRNLKYRYLPQDDLTLQDAFMLRGGLTF